MVESSSTVDAYIGGLVAYNQGKLSYCYNIGALIKTDSNTYAPGGLVGYNNTSANTNVSNNYYLDNTNSAAGSGSGAISATPLSFEQMQSKDAFSALDFEDIWYMDVIPCLKDVPATTPMSDSLRFEIPDKALGMEEEYQTAITASPDNVFVNMIYHSENPDIVTVSPFGIITAKAEGVAVIIGIDTISKESAACTVTVSRSNIPAGYTPLYTAADLDNVRNDLNGKYILMNDIVFTQADFQTGGPYYNGGKTWVPIGSGTEIQYSFHGILDGNGFFIIGLQINYTKGSKTNTFDDYIGLFGFTNTTAVIKNLKMTGGQVTVKTTSSASYSWRIGSFAGLNGGKIINCINENPVEIVSTLYSTSSSAGGLVGMNCNLISKCVNSGLIKATNQAVTTLYMGGISGNGGSFSNNYGNIENCSNHGDVLLTAQSYATFYAAGIAGEGQMNVIGCYNTGNILADISVAGNSSDSSCFVSGIAQKFWNNSSISRCYNTGNVKATLKNGNTSSVRVAGICSSYGDVNGKNLVISNCFNAGDVEAVAISTNNRSWAYSSGIGSCGTMRYCYNAGDVTALAESGSGFNFTAANGALAAESITSANVINCYYLDNVETGVFTDSLTGNKLTQSQMEEENSFTGFSFITIWEMSDNALYPYPVLKNIPFVRIMSIGGTVVITGTAQYGNTLTANVGGITPAGATVTYQWKRGNTDIAGATNAAYVLTAADSGTNITVAVTGTGDYRSTVTSSAAAIKAKELISIEVTATPGKTIYIEGTLLETMGMALTLTYDDTSTSTVTSGYTTEYDFSTTGTKTVTVTYQQKTTSFTVTVEARSVEKITIVTPPNKTIYTAGDSLDTTGLGLKVDYNNGTGITVYGGFSTQSDLLSVGAKTVTVTYGGKTDTYTVTVTLITSPKYTVSGMTISKISTGCTVAQMLAEINNSSNVKIYNGTTQVSGSAVLVTGMTVKLMNGNTTLQTLTVIVTGDVTGTGGVSWTGVTAVVGHMINKQKLTGAFEQAARVSGGASVSWTDVTQIVGSMIGKNTITPR